MELELYVDASSNYSYPAVMLAEQAAAARGLSVQLRPIFLGPIFAAQGYQQPPFVQFSLKGEYVMRDMERLCAELGLRWRTPSVFPRRAVLPTRIAMVAVEQGWGFAFMRRVYELNFADDREVDDEPTMHALLRELGREPAEVLALATSQANKDRLRAQVEHAQRIGVFGAPMFVVQGERFWGQDRMQQALAWAERLRDRT